MDFVIKGYINNYGFCVKKNNIEISILNVLKRYFSVKPELNYENDKIEEADKYFDVYYQDDNYIVLPKFSTNITINIPKFNLKSNIKIGETEYKTISFKIKKFKYSNSTIKFNFNGKLRDYQQIIIDEILKTFGLDSTNPTDHTVSQKFPKGGLIKLSCGGGKCLGLNTPVLMYGGTIKMVQNIIIGDLLMGDDSKPRKVLSLARGRELMYRISQEKGESYTVNSSHILSLYCPKKNQIVDINIQDYLGLEDVYVGPDKITLSKNIISKYTIKGGLYGFKKVVEFEEKTISFDAYYLGNWMFGETVQYLSYSDMIKIQYYLYELKYNKDMPDNYNFKPDDYLIPLEYKYNSVEQRKKLMAGILDSSSSYFNYDKFVVVIENPKLIQDIKFIANSLGLFTRIVGNELMIKGPNLFSLPFKKNYGFEDIEPFNYISYYKITVQELEPDDYYGFEIDGNRRFLLGDFTVTHNTMLAIYLSWILGLKTLVVTHKEFLMDQWEKRIQQFTTAKVGRIRQNKIDVENKDIVIGMLRSLSIKDYPTEILHQFGLVIYDEVHHTGSRVDSQALLSTSAQYTIGLSATPERADGMTKIINWHIGDILYEMEKKYNYRVLVKKVFFRSSDRLFKEKKKYFQGRFAPNHTAMTSNLIEIRTRNQLIVNFIDVLKGMGRKILILSYRVEHLELLKKMVDDKIKADGESHIYNSYYYMGKTKRSEKDLAEKDGHIIFATMQLAEEGLDIAHLDTVIFALPVSIQKDKKKRGKIKSSKALIQSIGRILRNDKLEDLTQIPLVIDISDLFSIYSGWSNKRNEIYEKKNWYVQNFYWDDLEFLHQTKTVKVNGDNNTGEQNQTQSQKEIKPMNVMFDDITDEDFIEKNLMLSDEDAKKMAEQDNLEILSSSSSKSTKSDKSDKLSNLDKSTSKSNSVITGAISHEIEDTEPKISYGFGRKKIN